MAKFFLNGKWKKRAVTALTVALSLTLSLGIVTACSSGGNDGDEDDEPSVSETDTQLIKNGNFEFYSEMNTESEKKRAFINTPTSWTATTGSPSSDTMSGIINSEEWETMTSSSRSLILEDEDATMKQVMDNAVKYWDDASVYDRLEFYDHYSTMISSEEYKNTSWEKFFADYQYSIDFEDVENLHELGDEFLLHETKSDEDGEDAGSSVLMIHNQRTSDGVIGTAQYYTSSTTVTLNAGTAAKVSVWVKTADLYHYYDSDRVEVTANAGAYISVKHSVGGTALEPLQIKNINTREVSTATNNGWTQYTVYVRASTFATSTFQIILGLGQGSTSDRYEQVNGYAFFDDLECEIITSADYETATYAAGITQSESTYSCGIDSLQEKKIFDATKLESVQGYETKKTYALDLYAGFDSIFLVDGNKNTVDVDLTSETSGNRTSWSAVPDNRNDGVTPKNKQSIVGTYTFNQMKAFADENNANYNGYFKNVFKNDFADTDGNGLYPYNEYANTDTVLLLSTNGAAYTATVNNSAFTLDKNERMLVSFFVKTSSIRSGKSGATVTLVDGDSETTIGAFDSTTIATVDVNDDLTDIYNGWTQCFFFVENTTDDPLSFYLKLSYGPTAVDGTTETDYCDGYAAFTNFQTKSLSSVQYNYASKGTYAKAVSLTGRINPSSKFDAAARVTDIKDGFALPVNFNGLQSGSINLVENGYYNPLPSELTAEKLYTGLLNSQYAQNYLSTDWGRALNAETNADLWWKELFGDSKNSAQVANQPLVIYNGSDSVAPAYGYTAADGTVSANTYQKITMRVKVSDNATAYIYLIDTSDKKSSNSLMPIVANIVYWYDDEGNITYGDPSEDDVEIAYYLQENGLYTKEKTPASDATYYANLWNYEKDSDGNLVLSTDNKTVAFYYNEKDETYYAYYDKDKDSYTQPVTNLPASEGEDLEHNIVRYNYSDLELNKYGACIEVSGTNGEWVEVSFYIHTGSEEKSYRLEVWAGSRFCEVDNDGNKTVTTPDLGIPAYGYVFFDAYTNGSDSTFDTMKDEYTGYVKDALNANVKPGEDGYLDEEANLPRDYEAGVIYYTFTFYDSPAFRRYDVNEDEDKLGNPYGSYKQSDYEEKSVYFAYKDLSGDHVNPVQAIFLDYSAFDVEVEQDNLGADNSAPTTPSGTSDAGELNPWLLAASIILAAALLFAIGAFVVRYVMKKYRTSHPAKAKPKKVKKEKKQDKPDLRVLPDEEPEEAEEPVEANPTNEDDPYND